jgi:hypothetical protein
MIPNGQSNLINEAFVGLNSNSFEGTRRVLDIASCAGRVGGCTFSNVNCPEQTARDAFLAGGGTAINAIRLNDRDFFGIDPTDTINALQYGSLNVIGGACSRCFRAISLRSALPLRRRLPAKSCRSQPPYRCLGWAPPPSPYDLASTGLACARPLSATGMPHGT